MQSHTVWTKSAVVNRIYIYIFAFRYNLIVWRVPPGVCIKVSKRHWYCTWNLRYMHECGRVERAIYITQVSLNILECRVLEIYRFCWGWPDGVHCRSIVIQTWTEVSIHYSPAYLGSGHGGSRPRRLIQTSLSPTTVPSSSLGILRRSQARWDI